MNGKEKEVKRLTTDFTVYSLYCPSEQELGSFLISRSVEYMSRLSALVLPNMKLEEI